ncbi:His/Gly/Thr/Pro-type tRNA ligase C-terminal domain-containing protein [Methylocystis bryophila]
MVVGPKDLADGKIELKRRRTGQRENLSPEAAVAHVVAAVKAAQGGSE